MRARAELRFSGDMGMESGKVGKMGTWGSFGIVGGILLALGSIVSRADDCSARWVEYSNRPYESPLFPETHAHYYRFTFKLDADENVNLRFTQSAESARYVSYVLYEQDTMTAVSTVSDPSNANPYTVEVSTLPQAIAPQFFLGSSRTARRFEIWYRTFLPGATYSTLALPRVEAVDALTGAPIACPVESPKKLTSPTDITQIKRIPPAPGPDGRIGFYCPEPSNIFANQETQYLGGRLDWSKKPMAVIELRPPTFPVASPLSDWAMADVRYWSFCIVSAVNTKTSGCLADYEVPVGSDGRARFLVAHETEGGENMRALAASKGLGFLPRGKNFIPVLIYRNILPRAGFAGVFPKGFYWPPPSYVDSAEAKITYRADKHIGEYAPQGQLMDLAEFKSRY